MLVRVTKDNRHPGKKLFLLPAASAVMAAFSMTFEAFSFLIWFGMSFLIYCFISEKMSSKKAFRVFITYGLIYNFLMLHWLFNLHPLTWMGYTPVQSFILTFLAWFSLCIFESLFYGIAAFTAFLPSHAKGWVRGMLAVLIITLVEWSRGFGPLGFPWGRLAISQYLNIKFIQTASVFGIIFISFVILLVNYFIAIAVYELIGGKMIRAFSMAACAILIFFVNFAAGTYMLGKSYGPTFPENIAIVQGNIGVSEKWSDERGESIKDIHFRLTREAVSEFPETKYVFWAESAIPTNLTKSPELVYEIASLSEDIRIPLIIGAIMHDSEGGLRNAIVSITSEGIGETYYKRHPVPVGEYIPFKEIVFAIYPKAKESRIAGEGLVAGTETGLMKLSGHELGPLVCYDSIFPSLSSIAVAEGADILFVASNDSWYKRSSALAQHNAQSVFRAVETRKYLIRAANTGISSIISEKGQLLSTSTPNEEYVIGGTVLLNSYKSFYTKTGDLFMFIVSAFYMLIIINAFKRTRKTKISGKVSSYKTIFRI